jgi:hypothetical protein
MFENTGSENTGSWNSGNFNCGNRNSGDGNPGNRNSGDRNFGDWNSGDWNSGNRNSGDLNTGSWNSGNCNSGNRNSGNWNSGGRNSGNWNSGDWNTGYLNTAKPTVRMFNKDTGMTYEEVTEYIPNYFYFDLVEWVAEEDMTKEEKEENSTYEITGGYLKVYGYKEAWRRAWDNATEEDRKKTLELPNWDNEIFKEITGVDVERELSESKDMIEIDGRKYSKDTIKEALREHIN